MPITRVSADAVTGALETNSAETSSLSSGSSDRLLFGAGGSVTFGGPVTISALKYGGSSGTDITPGNADTTYFFGGGLFRGGYVFPGPSGSNTVYVNTSGGLQPSVGGMQYEGVDSVAEFQGDDGAQGDITSVQINILFEDCDEGDVCAAQIVAVSENVALEDFDPVAGTTLVDQDVDIFGGIVLLEKEAEAAGDVTLSVTANHGTTGAIAWAYKALRMVPVAGGGGLDVTITPSGGISFSGTAQFNRTRNQAVSGGVSFSGSAPFNRTRVIGVSGGLSFGGTAPLSMDGANVYDITPSGGIVLSGTAPFLLTHVIPVSGGISYAGTAPFNRTRNIAPSGGLTFGGTNRFGFTKTLTPSGGITFGGSAPISFAGEGGTGGAGSRVRMVGIGTMQ